MKKKVIATMLAGLLCVGMLSGCGGTSDAPADNSSDTGSTDATGENEEDGEDEENGAGGNAAAADGEIYEVVIQFPTLGDTPQDLQLVEDALNEITEPEIGVHVTFYPSSAFELNNTTTMMVSSGEKLDLAMCMFEGGAQGYVNKGMLIELDDLVEQYGQDILAAEGKAMAGGYYNGTLYAVPTEEKMGRVKAFE